MFEGVVRRELYGNISKCGFPIGFYVNAIGVSVNGKIQVIYGLFFPSSDSLNSICLSVLFMWFIIVFPSICFGRIWSKCHLGIFRSIFFAFQLCECGKKKHVHILPKHPHITTHPPHIHTRYKPHTYTHPHITKPTSTHTHTLRNKSKQPHKPHHYDKVEIP